MNGPERIVFVGSGGPHLLAWGKLLSDAGVQVDLVATRPLESPWPHGRTLHAWQTGNGAGPIGQLKAFFRASRALRKEEGVDLVHSHYLGKPTWLAARSGKPVVASVWGTDVSVTSDEYRRWWIRAMTRRSLRRVDAVTAHSAPLAERLREIGVQARKIHLVPWGIDRSVFSNGRPATPWREQLGIGNGTVLLSLRWSDPIYQIREIASAFAQIAGDFPDAVLVLREFASPRSYSDVVRGDIERLGIRSRVRWVEWIEDRHQLADLFRSCDVGISYPTEDGYPLSVQEAMSCGLVPVISRLATTAGLVTDGVDGRVVDSRNVRDLARTLRQLLERPEAIGRCRAALLDPGRITTTPQEGRDRLLEVYRSVLEGRRDVR